MRDRIEGLWGRRPRTLVRFGVWLDREVLLGGLPLAARRLGILLLLGALAVEIPWLVVFLANPFTGVFWVGVALTIGAIFLESRMLSLRSYGFAIEPISAAVEVLCLLLIGPSFLPFYVTLYVCGRVILRPQQPLYRQLVSGQVFFFNGAIAATWFMLWPAWSHLTTLPLLALALGANMLMTLTSVLMVNLMVARAAGGAIAWRASLREIVWTWPGDLAIGAMIVLAVQAYAAWGPAGLLLLCAAAFAPVMLLLAPDADRAWRIVSEATMVQLRQDRRRERLEEALISEAELAYTDPVTGLGNRYRFERDISSVREQRSSMILIVGDIAGLASVNDHRGHDVGDELIRAGATGLRRALRASDKIYRFGGDEFAALIPINKPAEMEQILERINSEIRRAMADSPDLHGVRSWMRLGWASSNDGLDDLYDRADATMLVRREQERLLGMSVHA